MVGRSVCGSVGVLLFVFLGCLPLGRFLSFCLDVFCSLPRFLAIRLTRPHFSSPQFLGAATGVRHGGRGGRAGGCPGCPGRPGRGSASAGRPGGAGPAAAGGVAEEGPGAGGRAVPAERAPARGLPRCGVHRLLLPIHPEHHGQRGESLPAGDEGPGTAHGELVERGQKFPPRQLRRAHLFHARLELFGAQGAWHGGSAVVCLPGPPFYLPAAEVLQVSSEGGERLAPWQSREQTLARQQR